jgi:Cu/Zn superoxide dismutase
MNKFLFFFFVKLLLTVYTKEAVSLLEGTKGNSQISGKISFMKISDNKTIITGTITGLVANSIHGFHIHEFGDLSKEDGTATGEKKTLLTHRWSLESFWRSSWIS